MKRLLVMLAVLGACLYVGCKEDEGNRCQIDTDCASGTCNKSKGTCSTVGDDIMEDAEVPDGPADGTPMPDAMPDMMPDA